MEKMTNKMYIGSSSSLSIFRFGFFEGVLICIMFEDDDQTLGYDEIVSLIIYLETTAKVQQIGREREREKGQKSNKQTCFTLL